MRCVKIRMPGSSGDGNDGIALPLSSVSPRREHVFTARSRADLIAVLRSDGPLNPNFDFHQSTGRDPIHGYFISPSGAHADTQLRRDNDGAYIRVTATKADPYLVINGLFYQDIKDGFGAALRVKLRANCHSSARITIFDVTGSGGLHDERTRLVPCPSDWTELSIFKIPTIKPDPSDNYSVGLAAVQPGDWFELREISLFSLPKDR